MAKSIPSVLKRPMVTEKSTTLGETNRYVFEVADDATKPDVKQAVQAAFNVTVLDVNMIRTHTKPKRFGQKLVIRPRTKKAIIRLKDGDKIQLFENL
ncbi:MAG: 50S ribosomal protein L23 [Dehalococcoidia bacterium]|nr:50S ribosomal protein L23 [Dehalococcoidia bacterium]